MAYLAWAIAFVSGMTAAVILALNDHLYLAAFVLVVIGLIEIRQRGKSKSDS